MEAARAVREPPVPQPRRISAGCGKHSCRLVRAACVERQHRRPVLMLLVLSESEWGRHRRYRNAWIATARRWRAPTLPIQAPGRTVVYQSARRRQTPNPGDGPLTVGLPRTSARRLRNVSGSDVLAVDEASWSTPGEGATRMRRSRLVISHAPDPAASARAGRARTRFSGRRAGAVALAAAVAAAVAPAGSAFAAHSCTTAAGTTTCVFPSTGDEQMFIAPEGVTSVHVVARGAGGGTSVFGGAGGGRGAVVSGDLAVPGNHVLYVEVGGVPTVGSRCYPSQPCDGGFNGGGSSTSILVPGAAAPRTFAPRRAPTRTRSPRACSSRQAVGAAATTSPLCPRRGGRRRGGTRPGRPGRRFLCAHRRYRRRPGHGERGRSRRSSRRRRRGPGRRRVGGYRWGRRRRSLRRWRRRQQQRRRRSRGGGGGGGSNLVPAGGTAGLTSDPPQIAISYPAVPLPEGPAGPAGPQGPAGPAGPQGPPAPPARRARPARRGSRAQW